MFPGRAVAPKSCWFSKACPSRIMTPALPSSPLMGLFSDTCRPFASLSMLSLFRPTASTWQGWLSSPLNMPAVNISKLATATPSLRRYIRPDCLLLYCHLAPAPASSRTETVNRSSKRRVRSGPSIADGHDARSCSMRGRPPTSKCCHRPCDGIEP